MLIPTSNSFVGRRKVAAARALCSAILMEASVAPSIRWKPTRLPPESTTATFIFQFRFFASATAACISASARSSDIGGPYGVSNGILSGTKSRGFVSVGCSARLAPAALPVFSFNISPPQSSQYRSLNRQWIATRVAAPLRVVLDLEGQGGEVASAPVIDNYREPM